MCEFIDLGALISVFVGGVITLMVAHYYYYLAGRELKEESGRLRRLISIVLTSLEKDGVIELNKDSNQEIIGIIFRHISSGGIEISKTASAPAELIPAKPK